MAELLRFTTEYSPVEDRIRLIGEDQFGQKLGLWLNLRMCQLLLSPLLTWLCSSGTRRPVKMPEGFDYGQHFEQVAASSSVPQQPPVLADPGGQEWLAVSVDFATGEAGVRLTFKPIDGACECAITFDRHTFRQWLGIVYSLYQTAEWPLDKWPKWMEDTLPGIQSTSGYVVN